MRLRLALAGPGLVGAELLSQLASVAPTLASRGLHVRLVGVCNSSRAAIAAEADGAAPALDPAAWRPALDAAPASTDALDALCAALTAGPRPAVFVDCTASDGVPDRYTALLSAGVSVVAANKNGPAGDAARAAAAAAASANPDGGGLYRFEATVGAGLPVLSTLADLVATGDTVRRVTGVFSGTMSKLFADLDGGGGDVRLSGAVAAARAAGYTEPDPRDDLSGADVARKAVILARAAGYAGMRLADVVVEALIPPHLADRGAVSADAFVDGLAASDLDASIAARAAAAAATGAVLRYVATVDVAGGSARVGVEAVPAGAPLAAVGGGDNMFVFVTARYPDAAPLVVRGPGAGAAVTAAGVLGDVLAVARAAGAKV